MNLTGNCGKCAVRIVEGDVPVNTMDRMWFSEEQLENGYRLGCQVFSKTDILVEAGKKDHEEHYKERNEDTA